MPCPRPAILPIRPPTQQYTPPWRTYLALPPPPALTTLVFSITVASDRCQRNLLPTIVSLLGFSFTAMTWQATKPRTVQVRIYSGTPQASSIHTVCFVISANCPTNELTRSQVDRPEASEQHTVHVISSVNCPTIQISTQLFKFQWLNKECCA